MYDTITERFVRALNALEANGEVEVMTALFSNNCEVGNVAATGNFHGRQGATEFWTNYRLTFDEVRSVFRNRIDADGNIALEWTTEGKSKNGGMVKYDGVSIIETDGEKITRFHAYFDANKLGQQVSEQG